MSGISGRTRSVVNQVKELEQKCAELQNELTEVTEKQGNQSLKRGNSIKSPFIFKKMFG